MILLAAEAGADAVKFQTFNTKHYISARDKKRFNMLKSFELSNDHFRKLKKYAHEKRLALFQLHLMLEVLSSLVKLLMQ